MDQVNKDNSYAEKLGIPKNFKISLLDFNHYINYEPFCNNQKYTLYITTTDISWEFFLMMIGGEQSNKRRNLVYFSDSYSRNRYSSKEYSSGGVGEWLYIENWEEINKEIEEGDNCRNQE